MQLMKLDTRRIIDWETFHDLFAEVLGFPDYYGRNMNAWIDCMTDLDDTPTGGIVILELEHVDDFSHRCPEQYQAIINGTAFVNWRKIEIGEPTVIALSFYKSWLCG